MKKFISQKDMRIANILEVLSLIRREKSVTRKEIQNLMGLSWGGVSQIVSRLLELSYVVEEKSQDNVSSGRKPGCIGINASDNYIIGIDVNMSGLYAVVINLKNEIIYEEGKTPDIKDKESFLCSIYELLDSVTEKYKKNTILALGVAMQGEVDTEAGISLGIAVEGWRNIALADMLTERYGVPSYIAHDPDCILSAAARENKEDAILVRLDKGLGMAVMKSGNLIIGSGMHEIGRCKVVAGNREEELHRIYFKSDKSKEEKRNALAFTIANSIILFNVKKLLICGTEFSGEEELSEFKKILEEYSSRKLEVRRYDVKRAAFGAAIFAIEDYLKYIK